MSKRDRSKPRKAKRYMTENNLKDRDETKDKVETGKSEAPPPDPNQGKVPVYFHPKQIPSLSLLLDQAVRYGGMESAPAAVDINMTVQRAFTDWQNNMARQHFTTQVTETPNNSSENEAGSKRPLN